VKPLGRSAARPLAMPTAVSLLSSDDEDDGTPLAERLARRSRVSSSLAGVRPQNASEDAVICISSDEEEVAPPRKRLRKTAPLAPLSPRGPRAQHKASSNRPAREPGAASEPADQQPADQQLADQQPADHQPAPAAQQQVPAEHQPAPAERPAPSQQQQQAYLAARRASVKSRRFSLSSVTSGTISTARTIKPMTAWAGLWPALREFLQNTIDHLQLLAVDGRLHAALRVEHTSLGGGERLVAFWCGDVQVRCA
jgi:hypothetical protein